MIITLNRKILKLIGKIDDIKKLLQGISTNDINKINDQIILYNLFLSPDGRFLFDNFIFIKEDLIHLDCHPNFSDQIISHIKKYKMRTSIDFEKTKLKCYVDLDKKNSSNVNEYLDYRLQNPTIRIYTEENLKNTENETTYHLYRVQNNMPEGSYDMIPGSSLPIYFKMHELNAINLSKGCYIGQEPTNRLYRTGIIRKELRSFLEKNFDLHINNLEKSIISDGKAIGTLCSIYDNEFGFILINKEQ